MPHLIFHYGPGDPAPLRFAGAAPAAPSSTGAAKRKGKLVRTEHGLALNTLLDAPPGHNGLLDETVPYDIMIASSSRRVNEGLEAIADLGIEITYTLKRTT